MQKKGIGNILLANGGQPYHLIWITYFTKMSKYQKPSEPKAGIDAFLDLIKYKPVAIKVIQKKISRCKSRLEIT